MWPGLGREGRRISQPSPASLQHGLGLGHRGSQNQSLLVGWRGQGAQSSPEWSCAELLKGVPQKGGPLQGTPGNASRKDELASWLQDF